MEQTVTLRDQIRAGLVAGISAGVLTDVFLFAMQVATGTPADEPAGNLVFVAAGLLPPAAYPNAAAVPLGIVVHLCVSVAWALGYVYLLRTQPQLLTRPWISGAAYGLVVYVFTEIILITAAQYHHVTTALFVTDLIAHVAFYGIPVGVIVSRLLRPMVARPSTSAG